MCNIYDVQKKFTLYFVLTSLKPTYFGRGARYIKSYIGISIYAEGSSTFEFSISQSCSISLTVYHLEQSYNNFTYSLFLLYPVFFNHQPHYIAAFKPPPPSNLSSSLKNSALSGRRGRYARSPGNCAQLHMRPFLLYLSKHFFLGGGMMLLIYIFLGILPIFFLLIASM